MKLSPLKTGDMIDIIAPGRGVALEELSKIAEIVIQMGFVPRIPKDLLGDDVLCSNTHEKRFRQLKAALSANDSQAVWCVRGGYGTTQLIPDLLGMPKPKTPKWVMGYSDITALHLFLNHDWAWPTMHGPVLYEYVKEAVDGESKAKLLAILTGAEKNITHVLTPLNDAASTEGSINADIIGGNMTIVQCSLGTFWHVDTKQKILLLEDCDEADYRIDRMLVQFEQAHLFEEVQAIIFGAFTGKDDAMEAAQKKILKRFADRVKIPVLHTEKVGHRSSNYPILLGTNATLVTGASARVEVAL